MSLRKEEIHKAVSWQSWALLGLLSLIWGSSFILMKKGLLVYSDVEVACLRIFFTMSALLPFAFSYLNNKIHRKDLWPLLGVTIFGSGIPPFLFTKAQTQIDSALSGVLNSLTPLFAFLFGILFFGMVFHRQKLLGVLLGLCGSIILVLFVKSSTVSDNVNNWYGLFIILATMCYAMSVNIVKKYCQHISPITITIFSFSVLGPFAGLWLFLQSDFLHISQTVPQAPMALFYILILAVLGSAFSAILYFKLIQMTDALFASTTAYTIPLIALLWGMIDGEQIGTAYLVGMFFILAGIYLAGSSKNKF